MDSWPAAFLKKKLALPQLGKIPIRDITTALLEYPDHAFSICVYLLFYNLLIFNPILLSFGKGYLFCLVHLHSNFQPIPPCSLSDIGRNS